MAPVFLKVGNRLGDIPIEHVSVYTLIGWDGANGRIMSCTGKCLC
jgi:hypothetical protein